MSNEVAISRDEFDDEVEVGDIDARMDELETELDRFDDHEELDQAVDSNVLADERQLDET